MVDSLSPLRSSQTVRSYSESPTSSMYEVDEPTVPLNADVFEAAPTSLSRQLSSPNSKLAIAIGNAEGTRTVRGGFTKAYYGHLDPGNQRANLGTFSFQRYQNKNVKTPQQADQAQLSILRARIPAFEQACRRAGVDAKNPKLQAAFFDLSNQCSPRIWNRFLDRLPRTLAGKELSLTNLTRARWDAMFDDRGRFTATGLKTPGRAMRDQLRRMKAIDSVV